MWNSCGGEQQSEWNWRNVLGIGRHWWCAWGCCLLTQLCPTLCKLLDCSPPGSSVHGASQARVLEWAAISFSRGSSRPGDGTHVSCISRRILSHLRSMVQNLMWDMQCWVCGFLQPLSLLQRWGRSICSMYKSWSEPGWNGLESRCQAVHPVENAKLCP